MENMKMKEHFPMVFACESNPNFEVADASFYSYGEQYDSTTENQDSAIQHAVLNHDRLVEENEILEPLIVEKDKAIQGLIGENAELREMVNRLVGKGIDLINVDDIEDEEDQASIHARFNDEIMKAGSLLAKYK